MDIDKGQVFDGNNTENNMTVPVGNGDFIMLTHLETGRSLRSHGHRAPITKRHYQICGYGDVSNVILINWR